MRPISAVAIAFKGSEYRHASIVLLAKALGSSTDIESPLRSEASVRVRVRDQTCDGYNPGAGLSVNSVSPRIPHVSIRFLEWQRLHQETVASFKCSWLCWQQDRTQPKPVPQLLQEVPPQSFPLQPPAISHQPSAIDHQPSAADRQPIHVGSERSSVLLSSSDASTLPAHNLPPCRSATPQPPLLPKLSLPVGPCQRVDGPPGEELKDTGSTRMAIKQAAPTLPLERQGSFNQRTEHGAPLSSAQASHVHMHKEEEVLAKMQAFSARASHATEQSVQVSDQADQPLVGSMMSSLSVRQTPMWTPVRVAPRLRPEHCEVLERQAASCAPAFPRQLSQSDEELNISSSDFAAPQQRRISRLLCKAHQASHCSETHARARTVAAPAEPAARWSPVRLSPSLPKGVVKAVAFMHDTRLRLEEGWRRERAASKVQAIQRGRSVRKMYGVRSRAQEMTVFMDRKAEAVSIEAIVERKKRTGVDARKAYCGMHRDCGASGTHGSRQAREERAVTKMQAIQRGRSARKMHRVLKDIHAPPDATSAASPDTTALATKAPSVPQREPPKRSSGPLVSPFCQTSNELSPRLAQYSSDSRRARAPTTLQKKATSPTPSMKSTLRIQQAWTKAPSRVAPHLQHSQRGVELESLESSTNWPSPKQATLCTQSESHQAERYEPPRKEHKSQLEHPELEAGVAPHGRLEHLASLERHASRCMSTVQEAFSQSREGLNSNSLDLRALPLGLIKQPSLRRKQGNTAISCPLLSIEACSSFLVPEPELQPQADAKDPMAQPNLGTYTYLQVTCLSLRLVSRESARSGTTTMLFMVTSFRSSTAWLWRRGQLN